MANCKWPKSQLLKRWFITLFRRNSSPGKTLQDLQLLNFGGMKQILSSIVGDCSTGQYQKSENGWDISAR
jgi:hypothetical protein